jgi:hypothetical protein
MVGVKPLALGISKIFLEAAASFVGDIQQEFLL